MDSKQLNVGDVIYRKQYTDISRLVIDRVTAKRAYAGNTEFKREYHEGTSLNEIGSARWNTCFYYPATDRLKQECDHKEMHYRISKYDWTRLSFFQLSQVDSLLKEFQPIKP